MVKTSILFTKHWHHNISWTEKNLLFSSKSSQLRKWHHVNVVSGCFFVQGYQSRSLCKCTYMYGFAKNIFDESVCGSSTLMYCLECHIPLQINTNPSKCSYLNFLKYGCAKSKMVKWHFVFSLCGTGKICDRWSTISLCFDNETDNNSPQH